MAALRRVVRLRRGAVLAGGVALAVTLACSGPPRERRSLGDDLGTFRVQARETENTCGAGALGSRERFDFPLDLSRDNTELYWNESVRGRIDASLAFEFRAEVRVELRAATRLDPGCAMRRSDEMSGVLEERPPEGVIGFSGTMRYAVASDTDGCTDSDLAGSGLTDVPCRLEYALEAERERAPEP